MEDEEMIRKKMEDTRTSLSEKLETLENRVANTVMGATEAVSDTVEKVKGTVQETVTTVKDSVQEAVVTVKESVQGGVDTVKDWFDVSGHVQNHPWCAMTAAVCAGYWLETMLEPTPTTPAPGESAAISKGHNGHGRTPRRQPAKHRLLAEFGPELQQLKSLALTTMFGVAREMLERAMPGELGQRLAQIIDSTTKKLGAEPLADAPFESSHSRIGGRRSRSDGPMHSGR